MGKKTQWWGGVIDVGVVTTWRRIVIYLGRKQQTFLQIFLRGKDPARPRIPENIEKREKGSQQFYYLTI